jgi:hypothetical protein
MCKVKSRRANQAEGRATCKNRYTSAGGRCPVAGPDYASLMDLHPDAVATYRPPLPRAIDLFQADEALRLELRLRLPAQALQAVLPRLERMGALTAGPLWELMRQAEEQPPSVQEG